MDPTTGLILILMWAGVNAFIAVKRKRSGLGFFALSVFPILPVLIFVSLGTHGNGMMMGIAAFLCPMIAFIVAITVPDGKEVAVRDGSHGDFVRCPSCAEPVRKLAVKCRYCASDLHPGDQPSAALSIPGGNA